MADTNPLRITGQDADPANNPEMDGTDLFYDNKSAIDEILWNKSVPYQLAIVQASTSKNGQTKYNIADRNSLFTLPWIEDLSIHTPFAISTTATLGGIVEQHNAAPFRNISLSGTTGVVLDREDAPVIRRGNSDTIFGGTILALGATISSAKATFLSQDTKKDSSFYSDLSEIQHRTGYWQFHALRKFLESYASSKKTGKYNDLRLVFISKKDNVAYFVTPLVFEMRRNAQSPYEYRYNIQFRAWKRIPSRDILLIQYEKPSDNAYSTTSDLMSIFNRLNAARLTIANAQATIKAIYADFDKNIIGPITSVILGIKEAKNLYKTMMDFPDNMKKYVQEQFHNLPSLRESDPQQSDWTNSNRHPTIPAPVRKAAKAAYAAASNGLSIPPDATAVAGNLPPEVQDQIPVNQISLPDSVQAQIQNQINAATALTRADYSQFQGQFLLRTADFADRIGMGDPTYNDILGRTTTPQLRPATDQDIAILTALSDCAAQFAQLAAYEQPPNATIVEYVGGLAATAGISFRVPKSKFAVPFPYGSTLEQLSLRYLEDSTRWMEIAALNELRAPYVDEIGFDVPMLGNGNGNQIYVSSTTGLYQGQTVWLSSTILPQEKRTITGLTQLSSAYWQVSLSGDSDLAKYSSANNAVLHAYLPGTINSQQIIYIPSSEDLAPETRTRFVPGVNDLDGLLEIGGIDLLLTPTGDLAITPDGDCRVAFGLTNLIQRVRVALSTTKGSMLLHPDFGLDIEPGTSTADFTAQDLLESANRLFADDPAFGKVLSAQIQKNGPILSMSLNLPVTNTNTILPLTLTVQ